MERNLSGYIKSNILLKIGLMVLVLLASSTFGQAATITSVTNGDWNVASTWSGGVIPTAADDVVINTAVTLPASVIANANNLNINNFSSLTLYGELTVNGNLSMDNNGSVLDLKTGCQVLVKGDVALQNQVSIDISSYFIVFGNFSKSGSGNQGAIAISSAHVYIFGTVTTPWVDFTGCDATYAGTTTGVGTGCEYGNLDALINNGVGSVIPEIYTNTTNLTPSTAWYCSGGNVTLTVGEAGTISMLKWYNGTTLLSTVNSPTSYTYAANSAGSYSAIYKIGNNIYKTNTATVILRSDANWNGAVNSDWNNTANWDCNILPSLSTDVFIAGGKPNYPILSPGTVGMANNLTVQNNSSLTVSGNKLQIAGNISCSGTFTASAGTIEMKGGSAQTIPANTFTGNNLKDLIISNAAGVTLGGALNLTGILTAVTGNLASNGNLTLISSATQTALIDGSGGGQVTGNVTMQRYLSSGYGYKYFSSPFSNATVAQFSAYLSSDATISKFYSYDENQRKLVNSVWIDMSGWADYSAPTANLLNPMVGYAANLGSGPATKTITLSGTVNNGGYSISLSNNNRTITKGFNLVGNPYPSPINWDASSGWTKSNVDNAIYFFNATGGSDQYSGVYNSWVGGVSTGGSTGLIPSMQGFFVHLTSPGAGSLSTTNSVRTNDLNPTFKAASVDPRPILRFTACFDENNCISDAFVLYFDPRSTLNFDGNMDALKLMNTDVTIPNLYSITPDTKQLSINGIPPPVEQSIKIPLGLNILKDGWVKFSAKDITPLPADVNLFLLDEEKNITQNLKENPTYRFYIQAGVYNQRFKLQLAKVDVPIEPPSDNLFSISQIDGTIMVNVSLADNEQGKLFVSNMQGQTIMEKVISGLQTININAKENSGIYVVTMSSGLRKQSQKIVFLKK